MFPSFTSQTVVLAGRGLGGRRGRADRADSVVQQPGVQTAGVEEVETGQPSHLRPLLEVGEADHALALPLLHQLRLAVFGRPEFCYWDDKIWNCYYIQHLMYISIHTPLKKNAKSFLVDSPVCRRGGHRVGAGPGSILDIITSHLPPPAVGVIMYTVRS